MSLLKLNDNNYYSEKADIDYMSVSQFKDFAGTIMHGSCEDAAYKHFKHILERPQTTALLVGSYIDAFYEGTLDAFKTDHMDDICTKASINAYTKSQNTDDLRLLADYRQADQIIAKTTGDSLFSDYMSGQKQTIMTGNMFGTEWKIKMDSYHPDDKIVDLKVMQSMNAIWSDKNHMKSDFIRYWGYDIQGAVYQKIVEINTGKQLPFFIACATKEDPTNIEVIQIDQSYLDDALAFVKQNLPRVLDIKSGKIVPVACGTCYACRLSKKLSNPIKMSTIVPVSPADGIDENQMDSAMSDAADAAGAASDAPNPGYTAFHLFS